MFNLVLLIICTVLLIKNYLYRTDKENIKVARKNAFQVLDFEKKYNMNFENGVKHYLNWDIVTYILEYIYDSHQMMSIGAGAFGITLGILRFKFAEILAFLLMYISILTIGSVFSSYYPCTPPRLLTVEAMRKDNYIKKFRFFDRLGFITKYHSTFPSTYCAQSFVLISFIEYMVYNKITSISFSYSILMCLSVITTNNHYILDAVIGIVSSTPIYFLLFPSTRLMLSFGLDNTFDMLTLVSLLSIVPSLFFIRLAKTQKIDSSFMVDLNRKNYAVLFSSVIVSVVIKSFSLYVSYFM